MNKAFSFEKVFDRNLSKSLVNVGKNNPIADATQLIKENMLIRINETKRFYRSMLEADTEALAKDVYDRFYNSMVYVGDNTIRQNERIFSNTINAIDRVDQSFIDQARELAFSLPEDAEMPGEYIMYDIADPYDAQEIVRGLTNIFNDKLFRNETPDKLLNYLTDKYETIVSAAKEKMCGYDNIYDYAENAQMVKAVIDKDALLSAADFLEEFDSTVAGHFKALDRAKKEYANFLRHVTNNKYSLNNNKVDVDRVSTYGRIERIFTNIINELSIFHTMLYATNARLLDTWYNQSVYILTSMMQLDGESSGYVSEAAKSIASLHANTSDKLVKGKVFQDSLVELKYDELTMDCCIKETLAIASGVDVESKLQTIHEGLIESALDLINKVWTYIKGTFTKVGAWFDKFLKNNSAYIEKYKETIYNKPVLDSLGTITMHNYAEGLTRINQSNLNAFTEALNYLKGETIETVNYKGGDGGDTSASMTTGTQTAATVAAGKSNEDTDLDKIADDMMKKLIPDYDGEDWKEACDLYFRGSKEEETVDSKTLSMGNLANTVKDIPKIVKTIQADTDAVNAAFNKIIADIKVDQKQLKSMQTSKTNEIEPPKSNPPTPPTPKPNPPTP